MSINDPWNLDPTAPASNTSVNSVFIGENMAMANINNGMRQIASFLAQATSYKSADLSSSVSTNIAATGTGLYMDITGPNAINHFGSPAGAEQPNAAVFRFLQYDSSASVSHGANIKLYGATSRKMQPGDVQGVIHEGSGVWRELFYTSASGTLPMDSISVTTITNRSMSTSAVSTVTLNAASASVTTIGITALRTVASLSASVGDFTLLRVGGNGAAGALYIIQDQKASGTAGGTATSGSWEKVTLNTEIVDQIGITPATSVLPIPAGTYRVRWTVPRNQVNSFQTRLRDTTNGVTLATGLSTFSGSAGAFCQTHSPGEGFFTLTGTANVELQCQVETTQATNGCGEAGSFGTEVYAQLWLEKVA